MKGSARQQLEIQWAKSWLLAPVAAARLYKPPPGGPAKRRLPSSLEFSPLQGSSALVSLASSPSRREEEQEPPARGSGQELANLQGAAAPRPHETAELAEAVESEEQRNQFLVLRLYEALNGRDARRAQELLAPDLEWWFHGPPERQHMMRLLTGAERGGFAFSPRSVEAFGPTVIAEGADDARQLYWVHVWTVCPDGVITQLREYFNTDLTVTLLSASSAKNAISKHDPSSSSSSSSSSASSSSGPKCLWQSRRADRAHKSLPGLVLAI